MPIGGKRRAILLSEREWLLARIAAARRCHDTRFACRAGCSRQKVSYDAVWRFLCSERPTYKQSRRAAEQDRPRCRPQARTVETSPGRIDPSRLALVEETWAKTNMTRTHGRAPRGQRLVAAVLHGHWKTMTFVAGLRASRIIAPCVFDGPINSCLFLAWVTQFPVSMLRPGDVVVFDKLGSHKSTAVRRAIRQAGAPPAPPAAL